LRRSRVISDSAHTMIWDQIRLRYSIRSPKKKFSSHRTGRRMRTAGEAIALVLSPGGALDGPVGEMCAGGRHQISLSPFWSGPPVGEIRNWHSTRSEPGRPVAHSDRGREVVQPVPQGARHARVPRNAPRTPRLLAPRTEWATRRSALRNALRCAPRHTHLMVTHTTRPTMHEVPTALRTRPPIGCVNVD